ncbi:MAG TPA: hypothetical protein VKS60_25115 [Stellaceae bacterium]|nr:hypothetical protein [Stellaceae bacterium]
MHLDWSTLALQTVNFAVLVWLLHRFLYRPVLAMIDARKAAIERQFGDAKAAEDKAAAVLADIQAQRAGITAERDGALKTAVTEAEAAAALRRSRAEQEAQALLDGARKTLEAERRSALEEARRIALDLGAEYARRLLNEIPVPLRAEAWIERIEQHLQRLPKPELKRLVDDLGRGGILAVRTAAPLEPSVEQRWRDRLRRLLGDGTEVSVESDPALIAGAELHFPTATLRLSWQNALADMRSELEAHADAR